MFTEKQEFDIATEKWLGLGASHGFERKVGKPALAILVSHHGDALHYMKEAEQISQFYETTAKFHSQLIISDLNRQTMSSVLDELSVTDIVVIGKGNIEEVSLGGGEYLDWVSVSEMTSSHLKNSFTYRNHTNQSERARIPLGLFATGDHRRVYVPAGSKLTGIEHGEGMLLPSNPSWRTTFSDLSRRG